MRIYLTTAPDDAYPNDLATYQTPDLRVIYVHTTVTDGASAGARAMTILEALGKTEDVAGGKDHSSDNLTVLPIWLQAHDTEWLVFPDPANIPPRTFTTLIRALSGAACNLLVVDRPHSHGATTARLSGYAPHPVDWQTAPSLLATPGTTTPPPSKPPIRIPDSDWPTFRADCRDLLTPEDFAEVDGHYCEAFAETTGYLRWPHAYLEPATLLARTAMTAPTHAAAVAQIRGIQAAYFKHHYNLRVDPSRLLEKVAQARTQRFTTSDLTALRAYRDPLRPAICVLHDAGYPTRGIGTVTINDTAQAITIGQLNNLPLLPDALPLLRAALLARAREGALCDEPLITHDPRTISTILNRAAQNLGLLVGSPYEGSNRHTLNYWQYNAGYLITRID